MSSRKSDEAQGLVSAIITTCNREQFVGAAIQSVLEQDYAPIEIIVVDDGSTDGTAEVVARFGDRVQYLWQQNRGVSSARNSGIARARGQFLAFLDDDDLWMAGKTRLQVAVLASRPEVDIVYGHAEQFFSPELAAPDRARIRLGEGVMPAPLSPAMLARRSVFERIGGYDEDLTLGLEMDWRARASEASLNEMMLPDLVYRRRLHSSNLNRTLADQQHERLKVLKTLLDRRRRAGSAGETERKTEK